MTLTTPWRFTIWQYSHLRFTDARTFIPAFSQIFNNIILILTHTLCFSREAK